MFTVASLMKKYKFVFNFKIEILYSFWLKLLHTNLKKKKKKKMNHVSCP